MDCVHINERIPEPFSKETLVLQETWEMGALTHLPSS